MLMHPTSIIYLLTVPSLSSDCCAREFSKGNELIKYLTFPKMKPKLSNQLSHHRTCFLVNNRCNLQNLTRSVVVVELLVVVEAFYVGVFLSAPMNEKGKGVSGLTR